MGMKSFARIAMAATVIVHFGISMFHGTAHTKAHVPLSPAANIFVFTVINTGPLIGMVLTWPAPRVGAVLVITEALGIGLAVRPLRVRRIK
jgi:hypothetical protein